MPTSPPNVLLRSEDSGGEVSVIEVQSSAGFAGPPLHEHDYVTRVGPQIEAPR